MYLTNLITKENFGDRAEASPALTWMVGQGEGKVLFAGVAYLPDTENHPFLYGSERAHQLVTGEVIFVPNMVLGTDNYKGYRIDQVLTSGTPSSEWLIQDGKGEVLFDE